ncbi:type II secretion system F family protein [Bradyrhizobium sp. RDM4]|uniref:type II secretion system F family protein n=1 Tax=Bradyrhizobium sp. RDM4 TaxID=3378765 RepID=UPI0038FC03C3
MINNELWIIYALVFAAALLGFQALNRLVFQSRAERKIINRRLALSSELSDPVAVLNVLRQERGFGNLGKLPGFHGLDELVMQSGLKVNPLRIFVWIAALSGLFYLPLAFWLKLGPLAIIVAVPAAFVAGYLILRNARARRISRFSEQLPEALDIVVRGLRAGHPFRVALGLVARELTDPIGTEFGILIDEISFGADQQTAVDHLAARVGQEDLTFVSIAINIQSQTGGNLAEILQGLSRVLRNRSKLRLKIRALTAEGRLSGYFMTAIPFILFFVVSLINPSYFAEARDHALVVPAVVAGLMLLGIGNFVIFRMINFKF